MHTEQQPALPTDSLLSFDLMLHEKQQLDSTCLAFLEYIDQGRWPHTVPHHGLTALQKFVLKHDIANTSGVLMAKVRGITNDRQPWKRFIPDSMVNQILTEFHDTSMVGGHLGRDALKSKILEKFIWIGLDTDVKTHCERSCPTCYLAKSQGRHEVGVTPIPLGDEVNDTLAADIVGPLPATKNGKRYILAIVDRYNKMKFAYALPDTSGETIAKALLSLILKRGAFRKLLTDRASNLVAGCLGHLTKLLRAKKITTTPYMPQCDGITERFNRVFKTMLRSFCSKLQTDWDEWLDSLLFCINDKYDPSIGDKPSFLEYGRDLRLCIDCTIPKPEGAQNRTVAEFREALVRSLSHAKLIADEHLDISRQHIENTTPHSIESKEFKVGELVLLLDPRLDLKSLDLRYKGPYRITKIGPDKTTHYLKKIGSQSDKTWPWHVKFLRKMWDLRPQNTLTNLTDKELTQAKVAFDNFTSPDDQSFEFEPELDPDVQSALLSEPTLTPDDSIFGSEAEQPDKPKTAKSKSKTDYTVESVLDHKVIKGKDLCLIKWLGYPRSESAWEPVSNLNCPDLLAEYWQHTQRTRNLTSMNTLLASLPYTPPAEWQPASICVDSCDESCSALHELSAPRFNRTLEDLMHED